MATLTPSKRCPPQKEEQQQQQQQQQQDQNALLLSYREEQDQKGWSASPKKRARVTNTVSNGKSGNDNQHNSDENHHQQRPINVLSELTLNIDSTTTGTGDDAARFTARCTAEPIMESNTSSTNFDNVNDGDCCCFPSIQLTDSRDVDPTSLAAKKRQSLHTLYRCFTVEQRQERSCPSHHVAQDSMEQILQLLKQTCRLGRSSVLVELVGRHDDDNHRVGVASWHAAQNYTAAAVGIISSSVEDYYDVARRCLTFMETPWIRNHRVALLQAVPQNNNHSHVLVKDFEPFPFATHFLIHGAPTKELLQWMACSPSCTTVVVILYHYCYNNKNGEHHDEYEWLNFANDILNAKNMHRLEQLQDVHGHTCEAFVLRRTLQEQRQEETMRTVRTPTSGTRRQEARPLVETFVAGSLQDAQLAYRNVLLTTTTTTKSERSVGETNTNKKNDLEGTKVTAGALSREYEGTKNEKPSSALHTPHTKDKQSRCQSQNGQYSEKEQKYHLQNELDYHTAWLPPTSFLSPSTTLTGGEVSHYLDPSHGHDSTTFLIDTVHEDPLELLTSPSLSDQVERVSLYSEYIERGITATRKERRANLTLALLSCFLFLLVTPLAQSFLKIRGTHHLTVEKKGVGTTTKNSIGTNHGAIILSPWNNSSTMSNVSVDMEISPFDSDIVPAPTIIKDCSDLLPHLYTGCWKPKKISHGGIFENTTGRIDGEREPNVHVPTVLDATINVISSLRNEQVAVCNLFQDTDGLEPRTTHLRLYIRYFQILLVFFRHTMLGIVTMTFLPGLVQSVTTLHLLHEQALFIRERETKTVYKPFPGANDGVCVVHLFDEVVATTSLQSTSRHVRVPAVEPMQTHFPVWGKKLTSSRVR